jgi:2-polyprenyl-3-methyl-5-hydroxy-6-metoxy-1,4-benzoquinol methylase
MEKIKTILANSLVLKFKRLGFAGALRFKMLYWAYRLWPMLHIRDVEWDFVLDYLPKLRSDQNARVLDVGCTSSLFIYELRKRGYDTYGMDLRNYQEKLPIDIKFRKGDIRDLVTIQTNFDFVTCISVLEHIEVDQWVAIKRIFQCLKKDGKLLITIPTRIFCQNKIYLGFSYQEFKRLTNDFFIILDYHEAKGQILACLVKK